ncbi:MAG: Rpn family recombination-promoting nuclease/putative transposase [Defluviitaleaceae bacterium]|nr:Rpn family recombination-promoting nuclease/putative transposase [Defluviitaleaceae bacterium]
MTKLEHTLTNDILCKLLFIKYPDLLKRLVSELLSIKYNDITEIYMTNPEMPPETIGDKFCRLDINMMVNEKQVSLEIQVARQSYYPIRSLYYWSRMFSTALKASGEYATLPPTISINIIDFNQFENPNKFEWEFQFRETQTHELLTDKATIRFYELKKLPPLKDEDGGKELWLKLFKAKTEEDLEEIAKMEVPVMSQAIAAYRHVVATDEFKEIERLRAKARSDEAQAMYDINEHWREIVADKDAKIAELEAQLKNRNV